AALLAVCGFSSGSDPALVIRAVAPPLAAGVAPRRLAVDRRDGALYVGTEANRILTLAATRDSAWQNFAGSGTKGSLGDGGPAAAAQFDFAAQSSGGSGMAFDRDGNLFIADTNNATIRRVDAATGVVSSVAGRWATGAQSVALVEPGGRGTRGPRRAIRCAGRAGGRRARCRGRSLYRRPRRERNLCPALGGA